MTIQAIELRNPFPRWVKDLIRAGICIVSEIDVETPSDIATPVITHALGRRIRTRVRLEGHRPGEIHRNADRRTVRPPCARRC